MSDDITPRVQVFIAGLPVALPSLESTGSIMISAIDYEGETYTLIGRWYDGPVAAFSFGFIDACSDEMVERVDDCLIIGPHAARLIAYCPDRRLVFAERIGGDGRRERA